MGEAGLHCRGPRTLATRERGRSSQRWPEGQGERTTEETTNVYKSQKQQECGGWVRVRVRVSRCECKSREETRGDETTR